MGDGEQKPAPKVEAGGGSQKRFDRCNNRQHQKVERKALKEYRVPTVGLEKERFTVGTASDAADFEEVRNKLARVAGVNFKQGASMAQKAIEEMVSPSFIDPPDPNAGASPVEIEKWKVQYNALQNKKKAWKDAGRCTYQLLLVHCQPNMEQKIASSEKFVKINQNQDPVELQKLIRSVAHKHEEGKGGTMARVENDLRMYMCCQKPHVSNVVYYKICKTIREVIDVHAGRAGFHEGMFKERLRDSKTMNLLGNVDIVMCQLDPPI
jgi:hypothetical protein